MQRQQRLVVWGVQTSRRMKIRRGSSFGPTELAEDKVDEP